ncbi:MAG TPA: hypothetical protein VFV83_10795, partial [Chthoniobacteraceae bacterium]|nr:hypothetical protein [Chthoniobacteraceae bacterium]
WSVALFAFTFGLHTRHAQFPFFRHPDEPGKVEQVLSRQWNFHHPMLLLSTTRLVMAARQGASSEQAVVEIGRSVSAAFTAIAVVALSICAFLWRGPFEMIVGGVALALHHQLYELSHYMKEDAALLMGTALVVLAVFWFARQAGALRAASVGIACALCISGKYIGAILLLVALPVIWLPREERVRRLLAFGTALLLTLIVVNLPLLMDAETFRKSFTREMDFVVHGQRGMTRRVPHAQYWNVFIDNTTPAIWLGLLALGSTRWRHWRTLTRAECCILGFPIFYAVLLSFSPKSNDRYFLPATALLTTFAVLGARDAASRWTSNLKARGAVLLAYAVGLIVLQWFGWSRTHPGLWQYDVAFQTDDVTELAAFIRRTVPANSVIASDNRAGLPNERRARRGQVADPLPHKVLGGRYAADVGSLSELRAAGVTHVAVSESDYGRFFLDGLRPRADERDDFARRKSFYEELFHTGENLWERRRGTVIYLHPGIRLYRLR